MSVQNDGITARLKRGNAQFRSGREQAPGPRGSPQAPQALPADGVAELLFVFALTANTESCGASSLLWHLGHAAFCLPYTKASNL